MLQKTPDVIEKEAWESVKKDFDSLFDEKKDKKEQIENFIRHQDEITDDYYIAINKMNSLDKQLEILDNIIFKYFFENEPEKENFSTPGMG